jgi:hypothetical protein
LLTLKHTVQKKWRNFWTAFWRCMRFNRAFRGRDTDETPAEYNRKYYANTFEMWKCPLCWVAMPALVVTAMFYFYYLVFYGGTMIVVKPVKPDVVPATALVVETFNATLELPHEREHRLARKDFPQPKGALEKLLIPEFEIGCNNSLYLRLMPGVSLPRALLFATIREGQSTSALTRWRRIASEMLFGARDANAPRYSCACSAHMGMLLRYIAFRRTDFEAVPDDMVISSSADGELVEVFNPLNVAQLEYDTLPLTIRSASERFENMTIVRHSQAALFKVTADMKFIDDTSDIEVVRQRVIRIDGMGIDGNPIPTLTITDEHAYAVAECLDMLDGRSIWDRAALQVSRGILINMPFKPKLIEMFNKECDKPKVTTVQKIE